MAQEIATALGIPVSSLSYLLSTLVERQYLTRDGRRYSAGPGLARLQANTGSFTLAERAAPLVRTLRVPARLAEDRRQRSSETTSLRLALEARVAPGVERVDLCVRLDNSAEDHRL